MQPYQKLWAKPSDTTASVKTLLDHSIETGVVCKLFLTQSTLSPLLNKLATPMGIDSNKALTSICNIIASHDIGKAHPAFQLKGDAESVEILFDDGILTKSMPDNTISSFRHELYSSVLQKKRLLAKGFDLRTSTLIGQVQEMHHQKEGVNKEIDADILSKWTEMQEKIFAAIDVQFPLYTFFIGKKDADVFATLLHGLEMTCDWISSKIYTQIHSRDYYSYSSYLTDLEDICMTFIKENCMQNIAVEKKSTMKEYIPSLNGYELRPMQATIENIMQNSSKCFDLMMIESDTGSGKTEAALFSALYAMGHNLTEATGIYYGLPTSATSEAMQPRLEKILADIGVNQKIFLYTGTTWIKEGRHNLDSQMSLPGEQKFLRQFACGTVDQMMSKFHLIKHGGMGIAALATKIVIIDEMHAYDAYMRGTLIKALRWLKALGTPVIILSATLSSYIKKQILAVYTADDIALNQAYPLITVASAGVIEQIPVEKSASVSYALNIQQIADDLPAIADTAQRTIEHGGCLGIIANSVKKVKSIYQELKPTDIEVDMIRGNAPEVYKNKKSKKLLQLLGKDRKDRPEKSITVATQILEQSIDIDFDFMFSELCPIDLLLQRMGRYWRHTDAGTIRELRHLNREITILTGEHNSVYDQVILDNTLKVLEEKKKIVLPDDIRYLVDSVYNSVSTEVSTGKEYLGKQLQYIALSAADEIDAPSARGSFGLYRKKSELCKEHERTRVNNYETVDVVLLEASAFDEVKSNHLSIDEQINSIQTGAFAIPLYEFENLVENGQEVLEGFGCLKRYKLFKAGDSYVLDPEMGPCKTSEVLTLYI